MFCFVRRLKCFAPVAVALFVVLSGCGGGGGGGGSSDSDQPGGDFSTGGTTQREAIDSYVNDFIIVILSNLNTNSGVLDQAARAFVSSPNEATLAAVRSAWVNTRVPWEQSETALFGPVDFYGFDPAMDSWPVNQTDLEGVLASGASLTTESVANLDNSLKGFHTIEYLIYGVRGDKTASQLTEREGQYLVACTAGLHNVTTQLLAAWVSGIQGQPPFASEVVRAGQGSTAFPTEASVLEQIVRGMAGIADEVANGKIADPFDSRNPNIVESQFSGNSLTDFANNIGGLKIAYETSLSGLVSSDDPGLDAQTRAAIDAAIAAIRNIPETFRDSIQDGRNDGAIKAAQAAVRNVQNILETQILPVVLG